MHNFEYLLVLIICLSVPLGLALFHPRLNLRGQFGRIFLSIFLAAVPFLIWDVWATWRGHWSFNPRFVLGFYLINLPFEEVLFFFVIPFCCHFVWQIISRFENFKSLWQDFWLK